MKVRVGIAVVAVSVLAACGANSYKDNPNWSAEANAGGKFAAANCLGCHSTNGTDGQGPTFKGLSDRTVKLKDGTTVVADDQYLTTAIDDPDAQIVDGYNKGVMSAAFPKGSLTQEQVADLVAYINALNGH